MIVKPILILHRYLGVTLGVLMTVWCLSGFVMMYQSFPETTPAERRAGLERLDLSQCCAQLPIEDDASAGGMRVEMLNGAAVLRMGGRGGASVHDLTTGEKLGPLDEAGVRQLAETWAAGNGIAGDIAVLRPLKVDQWTAQIARRAQPMWQAKFDDPARTWLYINGASGEVIQDANLKERWLSWFGAVPHWLYPTILRENQPAWYQTVIWLSAVGCFLVVTGLIIGFVKLRSRSGKWFPYKRTMWLWHHVFGTFAGVLVLTWTFSGLLTMAPWGLLESKSAIGREDLSSPMTWGEARPLLDQARQFSDGVELVTLRGAPSVAGSFLVAGSRDGSSTRIGAEGSAPLQEAELTSALQAKGGLLAAGKLETLTAEDDYYYGHKQDVDLPVYRLQLSDPDATRVYFDYRTGEVRRVADATAKRYRWFESGLHSFDFAFMRSRPVWDVIVLILMAAVTVSCATGAWMSFTRVGEDAARLRGWLRRKQPAAGDG